MKSRIVTAIILILIFSIRKGLTISGISNLLVFVFLMLLSFVIAGYSAKNLIRISKPENIKEKAGEILGLIIFIVMFYITIKVSVFLFEFIKEWLL